MAIEVLKRIYLEILAERAVAWNQWTNIMGTEVDRPLNYTSRLNITGISEKSDLCNRDKLSGHCTALVME